MRWSLMDVRRDDDLYCGIVQLGQDEQPPDFLTSQEDQILSPLQGRDGFRICAYLASDGAGVVGG